MNPPKQMTNGEVNGVPHSAFLEHLLNYPLISDSVSTIQSYPIAQKTVDLTTSTYNRLESTFKPYLSTPYSYISPYVSKADSLGDSTLSNIDERFPIVKKPTDEVVASARSVVFLPVRKGQEGRDHVLSVYQDQRKGFEGEGVVIFVRASASTALTVTAETLAWVRTVLAGKAKEVKEVKDDSKGKN